MPPSPESAYSLSLPPEIWIRILSHNHDLNHLWSTCRRVSTAFEAYVEQVFAESHLRHAYIDFNLEKYNLGGKGRRPEISTSFHRFSEDKKLVYFRERREKAARASKALERLENARWAAQIKERRPECPNYTIQIRGLVNDTVLPGLNLSADDRVISFEWRGMLSAFFREEEHLRVLTDRWYRRWKTQQDENQAKVDAGEMTATDHLAWSSNSYSATRKHLRKVIRRARLKEQYKGNGEMLWAIEAMNPLDNKNILTADVPGARVGERFFTSMYLPQYLLLDEWSSLHRIELKAEAAMQEL